MFSCLCKVHKNLVGTGQDNCTVDGKRVSARQRHTTFGVQIYSLVLLARIILSWIPHVDRSNQIIHFLYQITDPVLAPVRRAIPPLGMIDISPIIVFIGLQILQRILLNAAGGSC